MFRVSQALFSLLFFSLFFVYSSLPLCMHLFSYLLLQNNQFHSKSFVLHAICQFLHIRHQNTLQQEAHSCNIAAIIYLNRCSPCFCRMEIGIEIENVLSFAITITIDEQQCTLDLFYFFPSASPEFYNKTDKFFSQQNFVNDAWMNLLAISFRVNFKCMNDRFEANTPWNLTCSEMYESWC